MPQNSVQWTKLTGITAVQGALTLSWVIYALYLPKLLVELGFSATLAGKLLIIEHLLEIAIEPTFGLLSDRQNFNLGNRFLYIIIGVVLASSFFIALPIVTFFLSPTSQWRWLLPALAIIWASAMAIFRSPLLALLTKVAPQPQMPIAVSCLTLIQQLINSLRFSVYGLILSLGSLFTFAIGSFSLLIAATFLRRILPISVPQAQTQAKISPISLPKIIAIIITAIAIGLGFRFLFTILPQIFTSYFGTDSVSQGMLIFSLLLAFIALPAGKLASQLGNIKTLIMGLIVTGISLYLISQSTSVIAMIIILLIMSCSFTMVLNGMIPFVLTIMPLDRAGFAIGTYFGSFGGTISFFDLLINTKIELNILSIQALICFLMASLIIYLSNLSSTSKA